MIGGVGVRAQPAEFQPEPLRYAQPENQQFSRLGLGHWSSGAVTVTCCSRLAEPRTRARREAAGATQLARHLRSLCPTQRPPSQPSRQTEPWRAGPAPGPHRRTVVVVVVVVLVIIINDSSSWHWQAAAGTAWQGRADSQPQAG